MRSVAIAGIVMAELALQPLYAADEDKFDNPECPTHMGAMTQAMQDYVAVMQKQTFDVTDCASAQIARDKITAEQTEWFSKCFKGEQLQTAETNAKKQQESMTQLTRQRCGF